MNFVRENRKVVVIIIFAGVLILIAAEMFFREWGSHGIAEDGIRTDFTSSTYCSSKPVINAIDRRVLQNERVEVNELAEVRNESGDKMVEHVHFYNNKGETLSGLLNTSVPGVFEITILAESPDTGRRTQKKICVLVDGRARKGGKEK